MVDKTGDSPKPSPSAFQDFDLSCDWNKYSNPEQTKKLIGKEFKPKSKEVFKNPEDFFICSINVDTIIKMIENQHVRHNPIQSTPEVIGTPNNRAHTLIMDLDGEVNKAKREVKRRKLLSKASHWEIFDINHHYIMLEKLKETK